MAIVRMNKMSLVAHQSEKAGLLRAFVRAGCVETVKTAELEGTEFVKDEAQKEQIESKLIRLTFALTFLRDIGNEYALVSEVKGGKISLKKENELVSIENFEGIARDEYEILQRIGELERINSELTDVKSESHKLNLLKEQYEPYRDLKIKFSELTDTKNISVFAGLVPAKNAEEAAEKFSESTVVEVTPGRKLSLITFVCHKERVNEIKAVLSSADFSICGFSDDCLASEKLEEADRRLAALKERRAGLIEEAYAYKRDLKLIKILYDFYYVELKKAEASECAAATGKAFVLEGWVPAEKTEEVKRITEKECKCAEVFFREPLDSEIPPTVTVNNKFASAFDGITSMFGVPNYRERDPNMFVAIFYFLFFGMMMGDAGYGLIIALACFLFVKIKKPVKNSGKMIIMFGMCGISTVIWGVLFGGWFGITLSPDSFLMKLTWFAPLDEPLKMFMLALGMGLLQIGTGFALKGIDTIKAGHVANGILEYFGWVIVFVGVIFISPALMKFLGVMSYPDGTPDWMSLCSKIGTYTALAGFAMILISGMVGKKNPLKMLTGALGKAYGSINVVSDLLSYSRIFGLGLATGVIGYVMNLVAGIIVNTIFNGLWIGWIPAAVIILVGHGFNLGINMLGAYVHDSRLQYVEFFGRFYEGTGHAFKPLGSETKYIYLDN